DCQSEKPTAPTLAQSWFRDKSCRLADGRAQSVEGIFEQDRLLAAGADRDQDDFRADAFFDAPDVFLRALGQVGKFTHSAERSGPAVELLVDGLGALHDFGAGGEFRDQPVLVAVGGADRDFLEPGQHVELGERDAGQTVHPDRVAHPDGVEPAAAPGAPGGGAELFALAAQSVAFGAVDFGRERAAADPRRVGFRDADHLLDVLRSDARARAGAAGDRARRGHERVSAVIDVEQRPLGALEEHALAGAHFLVEQQARVGHVVFELVAKARVAFVNLVEAQRLFFENRLQIKILFFDVALELLAKGIFLEQVDEANADARDLVLVGRADAAPGGADHAFAAQALARLVDELVIRHDHVGLLADAQLPVVL